MKKVLSSVFTLMLFVSLTNAKTTIEKTATFEKTAVLKDCHFQGCYMLAYYESIFGEADEAAAEYAYNTGYQLCMGTY